jgi:CHAD domain-containing protein
VAVRKLRSALRTFRTLLEANWVKEQRDRLRGLSVELSAARDADILLTRVRANVHLLDAADALAADAIFAALIAARDRAYARLREARQSAEHRFLPEELAAIAQQPAILDPHVRITGVLQPVLEKVYRRLRKCVRRCSKHPTDEALHAARIAAKHLRYALEASARVAGRKMMRVAREVERLQDVLGEEHDATLAAGRLRELVQAPADAFVAGEIARIEREAAARARSHWHVAWKRVKEEAAVLART